MLYWDLNGQGCHHLFLEELGLTFSSWFNLKKFAHSVQSGQTISASKASIENSLESNVRGTQSCNDIIIQDCHLNQL